MTCFDANTIDADGWPNSCVLLPGRSLATVTLLGESESLLMESFHYSPYVLMIVGVVCSFLLMILVLCVLSC